MNTLLLLLTLFAPFNLEEKVTHFVMRETVAVVRNLTRVGCVLEAEALGAKWMLQIQLRRGLAMQIDFERVYFTYQDVVNLQRFRRDIVRHYNLIAKSLELNDGIPPGLPRRIRLEETGWACCFQYIR